MRRSCLLLLASVLSAQAGEKLRPEGASEYFGMCDASAAVALGTNLFLAASDEDNVLRLYDNRTPGGPVREYDLNAFLEVEGKSLEADLEGAARIKDTVYWIGSHGRNRIGKARSNRRRLFATRVLEHGNAFAVEPVGHPYQTLLEDLIADGRFAKFHLAAASQEAPKEEDALNIEGLAATPEGHLYIGFRNPIPDEKALLVPLLNPETVIQGKLARFGDPIQLDLDGLGVRDMAACPDGYIIIAGSWHGGGHFRFYGWRGPGFKPKHISVHHLKNYNPESLVIYPHTSAVQVLSDDGTRKMDGIPCKELGSAGRFRAFWLDLPL